MNRRHFLGALTTAALVPPARAAETSRFQGTLCFFSKHLPRLEARQLGRALRPVGFGGVDLTVRKGGHVAPNAPPRTFHRS